MNLLPINITIMSGIIELDNFIICCERCGGAAVLEYEAGYPGEDVGKIILTCQECTHEQIEYVY